MVDSAQDALFGRLAVNRRFVTFEQLARATTEQERRGGTVSLGVVLVELGLMTQVEVDAVLTQQQQIVARRAAEREEREREPTVLTHAPVPKTIAVPEVVVTKSWPVPPAELLKAASRDGDAPAAGPPADPWITVASDTTGGAGSEPRKPPKSIVIPIALLEDDDAVASAVAASEARAAAKTPSSPPAPASSSPSSPTSPPLPSSLPTTPSSSSLPATTSSSSLPALALPPPEVVEAAEARISDEARLWLIEILRAAVRQGASDIHVHAGETVRMRRFGTLWSISDRPLPPEVARMGLRALLSDDDRARFDARGQVDCGVSLPGVGRFRVNVYRQHRGVDGVFRVVKTRPPTLQTLNLPASLARLTTFHQGIVLITGPGASGKSSTLAALVHMINEERAEHVVCIEDPIEVLHPSIRCVVNQRQAGRDTASFTRALKAALREDPDVIVIGEMRDRETAQLALTAAETGHLVLATLHTQSAVRTINRVIGEFPPAQQPNVRAMLAESLRAITSQRLLPRKDGVGVVPAVEVLMSTPAVANLIRESRTHQIRSTMQTGTAQGMQTLEAVLSDLVARGVIEVDVARRAAEDPRALVLPSGLPMTTTLSGV
jgi:twitching motility protein PilT